MKLTRRSFAKGLATTTLLVPLIGKATFAGETPYLENWKDYVTYMEMDQGVTGLVFSHDIRSYRSPFPPEPNQVEYDYRSFTLSKNAVNTYMTERQCGEQLHKLFLLFSKETTSDLHDVIRAENLVAKDTRKGKTDTYVVLNDGTKVKFYKGLYKSFVDGPFGVLYSKETKKYGIYVRPDFGEYGFKII